VNPTTGDRLRGMFLLSAYGDAFGAGHEGTGSVHSSPFPDRLPLQTVGTTPNEWGYWVTQHEVGASAKGITTDDTAYKLFILHPWLESLQQGADNLSEDAFRVFLNRLSTRPVEPAVFAQPRNAQIEKWLEMYRAAEEAPPRIEEFFKPDVPVVFGFFLFLETAVFRTQYTPVENYLHFRNSTILDQGYAKSATGFLTAITSRAFSSNPLQQRFDDWLVSESEKLVNDLKTANSDSQDVSTIQRILESMSALGENFRGQSPHDFMVAFQRTVVEPEHPPFMREAFKWHKHDPFRMLAEMVAATVYAQGDPYRALQALAFGSNDTDTVNAFLGTLMGVWFGETLLLQNVNLTQDLLTVEGVLKDSFKVDLDQRVDLFLRLRGDGASKFTV